MFKIMTKPETLVKIAAITTLGFFVLASGFAIAEEGNFILQRRLRTIVIDPGHGGGDIGARGADGLNEKSINLELARIISGILETRYRVILTRKDDYMVDIPSRTSLANHNRADLFLSIHTEGGFSYKAAGPAIFYYEPFSKTPDHSQLSGERVLPWNDAWRQNKQQSIAAAKILKDEIDMDNKSAPCELHGAPLLVLEGASMPALVIEPGNLVNPNEDKLLSNSTYLENIAHKICKGINRFFEKTSEY